MTWKVLLNQENGGGCKHGKLDSLHPCLLLTESESILCADFESCKEKNHIHFNKHIDPQSEAIYGDKKKSLHILEDGASGVQVGDVAQVIV